MVIAYIRVSTQEQSYQGQRHEIELWSRQNRISVDKWVEEKVSGLRNIQERTLGKVIGKMKEGDLLVCTELSRLGRNMMMVMSILNLCSEKNIRIKSIKDKFELSDSLHSKIIAFAFSLAAEIERNLIAERTREALAAKKAEGIKLGRPCGKSRERQRYDRMRGDVFRMLDQKKTRKEIADRIGIHPNTLSRYLKEEYNPYANYLKIKSTLIFLIGPVGPSNVLFPISEKGRKDAKGRCRGYSADWRALAFEIRQNGVSSSGKVINNPLLITAVRYLII